MRMDPELEALGAELRRLGTTVVPHGDHLCVRLPYFTSVRVRMEGGELRFHTRFGLASRDWAIFAPIGVLGTASASLYLSGTNEVAAALTGFLALLSGAFNLARLVLSENAVTRVQMLRAVLARGA